MRQLTFDGATNGYTEEAHPNGTIYRFYGEARRLGGKRPRICFDRRNPDGSWAPVREWVQGQTPFFVSHGAAAEFDFLPGGSVHFVFLFNVIDDDGNEKGQQFEEEVPGLVPPFTYNQSFSYTCSATDAVAREQAQGAQHGIVRALDAVQQARADVRAVGAKNEETLNKRAAELDAKLHQSLRKGFDSLNGIYLTRSEAWEKMIVNRLYVELENADSPVRHRIAQAGIAAAKAENVALRAELAALKKALKDQGIKV